MKLKHCPRCDTEKPRSKFYGCRHHFDKRSRICIECREEEKRAAKIVTDRAGVRRIKRPICKVCFNLPENRAPVCPGCGCERFTETIERCEPLHSSMGYEYATF